MSRPTIFHVDVNSAFLSWTAVRRLQEDPNAVDLRTIPSAVGGDVETRHGIITAKSIPAKKYGIKTGEPVMSALRKCPSLVLVKSDFQTYRQYSHALMDILRRYSPTVQQASIDEAYLDMTGMEAAYQTPSASGYLFPLNAAEQLKNEIRDTLGFTVNIGISTNKLLAKTASDFTKPDRIHTLYPEEVPVKLWPLPIGELHGCGKATSKRLMELGIFTIGDAAAADLTMLRSHLGEKAGDYIHNSANGSGSSTVHAERADAKSYSNETTTSEDITRSNYKAQALPKIQSLAESVSRRLQRDGVYATTIGVMVKTDQFQRHSRQITLPESTNDAKVIYDTAIRLLHALAFEKGGLFDQGLGLRLLGVSAAGLDKGEFRQMNFTDYMTSVKQEKETRQKQEKQQKLDQMMASIQSQFGKDAIHKGRK